MEILLPAKANQARNNMARRLTGVGTAILGVVGFVAADAPRPAPNPSVSIVREFVLECPPGDIPMVTQMQPKRADQVSLRFGCHTPDDMPDNIVDLKTSNKEPLGPDDHVLRLSVTPAEGEPRPSLSLTFPSGGLSFVIVTANCAKEGVLYELVPNLAATPSLDPTLVQTQLPDG